MKNYTCVTVCPVTREYVSRDEYSNNGVCARCGDVSDGAFAHYAKVVGEWKYPSMIDRIFRGVKPMFVEKK